MSIRPWPQVESHNTEDTRKRFDDGKIARELTFLAFLTAPPAGSTGPPSYRLA